MSDFNPKINKDQLFIDVGNSFVKAAYRDGVVWKEPAHGNCSLTVGLRDWIRESSRTFNHFIISSVRKSVSEQFLDIFGEERSTLLTTSQIPNENIDYETPKTLGIDRFLGCLGAVRHTGAAVVVIDAGSACTVDFMTADEIYIGGAIMPGLYALKRTFQRETPELPDFNIRLPKNRPGKSTEESLQLGTAGMVTFAIEGMLRDYQEAHHEYELVITGGHRELIAGLINVESKLRPNLIFDGMAEFLTLAKLKW